MTGQNRSSLARLTQRRVGRRGVLGGLAAGGIGVAAASLIGCGDDDDSTPSASPAASAAASPSGSAAAATQTVKKGGTWNAATAIEIPALDPYASPSSQTKIAGSYVYSRLFVIEPTAPDSKGTVPLKVVGDAAESYKASPDGKQYTITLKPNVKWHAPVSRLMTAEDVVFSWQRFTGKVAGFPAAAAANRLEAIESVRAVDARTVEFNLSRAYGPFLELLADANLLLLMPKETGTAFDPAKQMVGSGAFLFEEYKPGSVYSFKRNPEWHGGPDRPYLDRLVFNIIKEPAQQMNQFLAGNIDQLSVNGIDAGNVKSKISGVQFVLRDSGGLAGYVAFSQVSNKRANAPWTDQRVRQAMSMAINRDELLDIAYNLGKLKEQGIDAPRIWGGLLPISLGEITVNPQSDPAISPFFKYDPKAAKALLDQAGGGFTTSMQYPKTLGAEYVTIAETLPKYWGDIGVKVDLEVVDYASGFVPKTLRGDFPGLGMAGYSGIPDPGAFLESATSSTSPTNQSKINDPKVDAYLKSYSSELDPAKRKAILIEFQKYMLPLMYYIPSQWGAALSITAYQPNVRGPREYASYGYGSQGVEIPYFWKA